MHPKKIENLLKLRPEERYEFFVRSCADFQVVWGLGVGEDGWVTFSGNDRDKVFPLWSDESLADLCMFHEHKEMGATPKKISLEAFLNFCIPDMIAEGINFGVFLHPDRSGLIVPGQKLKQDIEEEVGEVWE